MTRILVDLEVKFDYIYHLILWLIFTLFFLVHHLIMRNTYLFLLIFCYKKIYMYFQYSWHILCNYLHNVTSKPKCWFQILRHIIEYKPTPDSRRMYKYLHIDKWSRIWIAWWNCDAYVVQLNTLLSNNYRKM